MVKTQDCGSALLHGLEAIGAHLSIGPRQIQHLHEKGELPTFKLGRSLCARRSELEEHFARGSAARHEQVHGSLTASKANAEPDEAGETPAILYGHRAIAARLGLPVVGVARLDLERRIPFYFDDGCAVASTAALDHWNSMKGAR